MSKPDRTLKVMSTLGVVGALQDLIPQWEARFNVRIDGVFAPTKAVLARLEAGESADVAILTESAVISLAAQGVLAGESRVDLARSFVGVAVRAGAARPDIATVAGVRRTLLETPSLVYSRAGASGIFFAALIERLGIAAAVNAKATVIDQGFTAELLARGEVELAVQQVSELMTVPGVDIVGRLPDEINESLVFSAARFVASPRREDATAFLRFLAASATPELLRRTGLEPMGQE